LALAGSDQGTKKDENHEQGIIRSHHNTVSTKRFDDLGRLGMSVLRLPAPGDVDLKLALSSNLDTVPNRSESDARYSCMLP
jgi:hypothetical protein